MSKLYPPPKKIIHCTPGKWGYNIKIRGGNTPTPKSVGRLKILGGLKKIYRYAPPQAKIRIIKCSFSKTLYLMIMKIVHRASSFNIIFYRLVVVLAIHELFSLKSGFRFK